MKHPTLFDMPPTMPSMEAKIASFKRQYGIMTHCAKHLQREEERWLAIIPFTKDMGNSVGQMMADSCRLYEEAGQCATGKGELSAIRLLCQQLGIDCDL